jgi:hypothetical protein
MANEPGANERIGIEVPGGVKLDVDTGNNALDIVVVIGIIVIASFLYVAKKWVDRKMK